METETKPSANGSANEFRRLRDAYNHAFHELASALKTNARIAAAEQEYHRRRDALFKFLMNGTHGDEQAPAVRRLAYVLWEQAGHPQGTAESDWYKAEALLGTRQ